MFTNLIHEPVFEHEISRTPMVVSGPCTKYFAKDEYFVKTEGSKTRNYSIELFSDDCVSMSKIKLDQYIYELFAGLSDNTFWSRSHKSITKWSIEDGNISSSKHYNSEVTGERIRFVLKDGTPVIYIKRNDEIQIGESSVLGARRFIIVNDNEYALFVNNIGEVVNSKGQTLFNIPVQYLSTTSKSSYFTEDHCFATRILDRMYVFDVRYLAGPYFVTDSLVCDNFIFSRTGTTLLQYNKCGQVLSSVNTYAMSPLSFGTVQIHGKYVDIFCDNQRIRYKNSR